MRDFAVAKCVFKKYFTYVNSRCKDRGEIVVKLGEITKSGAECGNACFRGCNHLDGTPNKDRLRMYGIIF